MKRKYLTRVPLACAALLASSFVLGSATPANAAVLDGVEIGAGSWNCPAYHLCMWEHRDYGGRGIAFYYCGTRQLQHYRGGYFVNRVSSLFNNQSSGTVSHFYDWSYPTAPVVSQRAVGWRANLAWDTAPDGNSANDRIDDVKVC